MNLRGNASLDFNAELLENFTWDGLALIKRDSTNFVNESAITGGNPILAFGKDSSKVLFEDMLGSSMGSVENGKFNAINRTSFGESNSDSELNFFTGKPQVEGLGYAFLFRNYRADQGKWQTADPKGYPNGWNNLAYCNNGVISRLDRLGLDWIDDIVSNIASSYAQYIIDAAVTAALGERSNCRDVEVDISNLDVSGLTITFDYEDAWTLFFVYLGSGTGTIDLTTIAPPNEDYSNTFERTDPVTYSVFDKNVPPSVTLSKSWTINPTDIAVNQQIGEWYSFSSLNVTNVHISGIIKFTIANITVKQYKE